MLRFLSTHNRLTLSRTTPTQIYHSQVQTGRLRPDPHQTRIINQLDTLYHSLKNYQPTIPPPPTTTTTNNWLRNWFGHSHASLPPIPSNSPRGIYLYGTVGTGKSMLMDLFYDSIKSLNQEEDGTTSKESLGVKRIHFHQFMVDIHQKNHQLQQTHQGDGQADVLVSIARSIAMECKVLCFDEFQVTDIVDAMILKRLLESLLSYGVVLVLTSNRHPNELYMNGIQRESFLGCIELIKEKMEVIDLNSGHDYRSENMHEEDEVSNTKTSPSNLKKQKVFLSPTNDENHQEFKARFTQIARNYDPNEPIIEDRKLSIWGTRSISVPLSTNRVAWFDFLTLCNLPPLSAADYLKIVNQFHVIFVNNVPRLSIHQRDMARRFILFIDAAYESKTKLMTLSEVPITEIFSTRDTDGDQITSDMRATVDDLGLDSKSIGTSSLFSGEEERFAWARAVSRLNEMSSSRWSTSSLLADLPDPPSDHQNSDVPSSLPLDHTHHHLDNNNKLKDIAFVNLHSSPTSDSKGLIHP